MFSEGNLEWLKERVSKLCQGLAEEEWEQIEPDWHEPYSNADVEEIVGRVVTLRGGIARGRRKRTKKSLVREETTPLSPRERWLRMRPRLQDWRKEEGFPTLIRLEELRESLIGLGATTEKKTVRDDVFGWDRWAHSLAYPATIKFLGAFATLYEIEQVYFSIHNVNLSSLKETTDMLARHFHCHPALALSAWLCDTPLHDNICIIFEGHTLKLEIASLHTIQPKSVMKAYSLGQREILNLAGKKGRQRQGSERTGHLYVYPKVTPGLTWQQRWVKWNNTFPEWKYSDAQTMVSAYSRVKRKWDVNLAWLEEIEKRLAVSRWEMHISSPADIGKKKESS